MPRTTKAQQQQNRVLLLQAAERVFARRGVEGASLDDVAVDAGLTKGAVYSNFSGKGELILEVIRHRQTSSQEAQDFSAVLLEATDDYARLEAWCEMWIRTQRSGERSSYSRLVFEFIPYALRDEELTRRFLDLLGTGEAAQGASPIPSSSLFARIPHADQMRILLALDMGLAALTLFDPEGVKPELYKTAVLSLARTLYEAGAGSDGVEPEG
ncbi:MAG TPA: TetR family transcriptional regulator [Candidatus Nesterenkonia stercoripullorum]|uniref:TetR family transcriptional regulator n=1 Tax=Candidatus Nesterenkonia stercoripullorum TaxID=2838701 RepID=A0A9D1UTN4_9MICC|nr:TetR family transcriptional regulator [Candidatus Nesterenkonia stercoripullorum]